MTLKVVFRRAARAEFDSAALRYDRQRQGLGAQFVTEIDAAIQLAASYPERFPIKHRNSRRAPVRRFPYSVFYRMEAGKIVVIGIFHGRRDPGIWQTRA